MPVTIDHGHVGIAMKPGVPVPSTNNTSLFVEASKDSMPSPSACPPTRSMALLMSKTVLTGFLSETSAVGYAVGLGVGIIETGARVIGLAVGSETEHPLASIGSSSFQYLVSGHLSSSSCTPSPSLSSNWQLVRGT